MIRILYITRFGENLEVFDDYIRELFNCRAFSAATGTVLRRDQVRRVTAIDMVRGLADMLYVGYPDYLGDEFKYHFTSYAEPHGFMDANAMTLEELKSYLLNPQLRPRDMKAYLKLINQQEELECQHPQMENQMKLKLE